MVATFWSQGSIEASGRRCRASASRWRPSRYTNKVYIGIISCYHTATFKFAKILRHEIPFARLQTLIGNTLPPRSRRRSRPA
jgi:hypothetical protein